MFVYIMKNDQLILNFHISKKLVQGKRKDG